MNRPRRRREGRPIEGLPNAKTLRIRKPYLQFWSALEMLNYHFDNWLLPREPEEGAMTRVILALQNILEYEIELVVTVVASRSSNPRDHKLQSRIEEDYASFKEKFQWLLDKDLISKTDYDVMDEIREIRNKHAHWRPSATRRKLVFRHSIDDAQGTIPNSYGCAANSREVARRVWQQRDVSGYPLAGLF